MIERGAEEETAREAARLSFGSMKRAIDLIENYGLTVMDDCLKFLNDNLTHKKIFAMAEIMGKDEKKRISGFFSALTLILRDILLYMIILKKFKKWQNLCLLDKENIFHVLLKKKML